MLTILVVCQGRLDLDQALAGHPSIEVLRSHDLEETLEKLARNRRIDAVLLLAGPETLEIARAILEENRAAPPLFAPQSQTETGEEIQPLPGRDPAELLLQIAGRLSA